MAFPRGRGMMPPIGNTGPKIPLAAPMDRVLPKFFKTFQHVIPGVPGRFVELVRPPQQIPYLFMLEKKDDLALNPQQFNLLQHQPEPEEIDLFWRLKLLGKGTPLNWCLVQTIEKYSKKDMFFKLNDDVVVGTGITIGSVEIAPEQNFNLICKPNEKLLNVLIRNLLVGLHPPAAGTTAFFGERKGNRTVVPNIWGTLITSKKQMIHLDFGGVVRNAFGSPKFDAETGFPNPQMFSHTSIPPFHTLTSTAILRELSEEKMERLQAELFGKSLKQFAALISQLEDYIDPLFVELQEELLQRAKPERPKTRAEALQ